jgi:hypothetical protein
VFDADERCRSRPGAWRRREAARAAATLERIAQDDGDKSRAAEQQTEAAERLERRE